MPDLGTPLLNSETLTLNRNSNSFKSLSDSSDSLYPCPIKTLIFDNNRSSDFDLTPELLTNGDYAEIFGTRNGLFKIRVTRINSASIDGDMNVEGSKSLEEFVSDWKSKKVASGVPENSCFLPFLSRSPTLVKCGVCSSYIYPGDEVSCSVRGCKRNYHLKCAKDSFRCSLPIKFKCPQHACFICKQKFFWRCVRCEVASHDRCAAWPDKVIHLSEQPGWAVCWRHPKDWRQEHGTSTNNFEDIFSRLPLQYIAEEFNVESSLKDGPSDKLEPPPYVHIRRNVYLVKKKRDEAYMDIGCTGCCSTSTCSEDCVCRVQSISCSKACRCSEACTNKPFRKEKKIRIVKTELCGWGVEAVESINKGEFIIEYVGEVIDDVVCTQRFWDMKNKEVKNFYMCEIRKDFTIDATFKGNASRFLNHSCDPNCKLEKWQVEGEIRVGVFAARSIKVGGPLTYDYRFVQFGPEVKCNCGAANCQGYIGAKRKINLDILDSKKRLHIANVCWGSKQKRSSKNYLAKVHKR